jgi:predicted RNase H-like HicB family nuclease
MVESAVTLSIQLEIATKQEGDTWIAWCLPLDVASQAKTRVQSIASLKEAVELWFESCIERGVLEQALLEAGFKRAKDTESIPSRASTVRLHEKRRRIAKPAGQSYITVSVPAYIAARPLNAGATR